MKQMQRALELGCRHPTAKYRATSEFRIKRA